MELILDGDVLLPQMRLCSSRFTHKGWVLRRLHIGSIRYQQVLDLLFRLKEGRFMMAS
jgi:hypothetical protein